MGDSMPIKFYSLCWGIGHFHCRSKVCLFHFKGEYLQRHLVYVEFDMTSIMAPTQQQQASTSALHFAASSRGQDYPADPATVLQSGVNHIDPYSTSQLHFYNGVPSEAANRGGYSGLKLTATAISSPYPELRLPVPQYVVFTKVGQSDVTLAAPTNILNPLQQLVNDLGRMPPQF